MSRKAHVSGNGGLLARGFHLFLSHLFLRKKRRRPINPPAGGVFTKLGASWHTHHPPLLIEAPGSCSSAVANKRRGKYGPPALGQVRSFSWAMRNYAAVLPLYSERALRERLASETRGVVAGWPNEVVRLLA